MDPTSFDEIMRVQRMMASRVMNESSMDSKIKLLGVLRDLSTGPNAKIMREHIIYESQMEGIMESEVMRLLEELKNDDMVQETPEGDIILT
ncbi:hypothetical protein K9L67_01745 [Candidatus Woesearchaeota archaeon]|nr:hypothetical protein [Candidatus Woesearchaeota archaeon]MCF7900927.1 hypothetical protein [Candidatus Woesearchaeota archaeon]MCF8012875.1 hypothetical protein [Candidatus Woesearchaeota archaeon]